MKTVFTAADFFDGNTVVIDGERFLVSEYFTDDFSKEKYFGLSRPHTLQVLGHNHLHQGGFRYVRHHLLKYALSTANELADMLNTNTYQVDDEFPLKNGWRFMKDVPTSGESIFVWLSSPFKGSNIHVANFVNDRRLIDGHIEYDAPDAIAWQPIMGAPA